MICFIQMSDRFGAIREALLQGEHQQEHSREYTSRLLRTMNAIIAHYIVHPSKIRGRFRTAKLTMSSSEA